MCYLLFLVILTLKYICCQKSTCSISDTAISIGDFHFYQSNTLSNILTFTEVWLLCTFYNTFLKMCRCWIFAMNWRIKCYFMCWENSPFQISELFKKPFCISWKSIIIKLTTQMRGSYRTARLQTSDEYDYTTQNINPHCGWQHKSPD